MSLLAVRGRRSFFATTFFHFDSAGFDISDAVNTASFDGDSIKDSDDS
jgi:hypothetical protein